MPSSFEALGVVLIALLPGATFLWAVERLVGRWGVGLSDRVLRFIGISALFHIAVAPLTYRLWFEYAREGSWNPSDVLPLWLWPAIGAYVVVPALLGTGLGLAMNKWKLPALLVGSNPAPTAWDELFFNHRHGYLRLKLKSGPFIGGAIGDDSYIGGFPEPADIYLAEAVEVDPDTGEYARTDAGNPVLKGYGVLVRWAEIEYLDFAPR